MNWADPDTLAPVYELPRMDGKGYTNRISLDRAAEMGLLPRVSGVVEDVLGKSYSLQQYLLKRAVLSAEGLPRRGGEPDEAYVPRVLRDAGEGARKASQRGSQVHKLVREFLETDVPPEDKAARKIGEGVLGWLRRRGASEVISEQPVRAGGRLLCGTPDILVLSPLKIVVDLKVTEAAVTSPYRDHCFQVGGYMSLADTPEGFVMYCDPWTGAVNCQKIPARFREGFDALYGAWLADSDWIARTRSQRCF